MCPSASAAEVLNTQLWESLKGPSVILFHLLKLMGTDCVGSIKIALAAENDELYPGDPHEAVVLF